MFCPQAQLQGPVLGAVGKGLVGKLSELEVSVVFELVSIGSNHLLIVVTSQSEQL